jgi:hypothetical protein
MYISVDFTSQIAGRRGLIHQFGVWLGCDLKNGLLLLLYIGALNFNIQSHIIFTYNNLSLSSLSLVEIFSV